jgi:hypothetical protein
MMERTLIERTRHNNIQGTDRFGITVNLNLQVNIEMIPIEGVQNSL